MNNSCQSEAPLISKMADLDVIFKALRLLPEFDGNPHVLPRFIHLCDEIVSEYLTEIPDNELAKLSLINGVLNKITGPAALILNSNGVPEDWDSIKTALINNFSDQRDETALYNDLMLATQGNRSPQEFYDRCVNLYSTIMTYITLHETIKTTIEAKRTLYGKLTMQAFCRGLSEPLGSRVRCMRPDSIQQALKFVQDELNVNYIQSCNRAATYTDKKPVSVAPMPVASFSGSLPQSKPFNPPARIAPLPNWQPRQSMWKPNVPFNQPVQFNRPVAMPTRTQQIFRAPPPNYNPYQQNFQLPPRNVFQNQGPKPMSGVSHYVAKERPLHGQLSGHDWRKQGNPPPSNYFKTREMNMNECFNHDYYQSQPYSYYEPEGYYCVEEPGYYSEAQYNSDLQSQNYEPQFFSEVEPTLNLPVEYQMAPHMEPEPSVSSIEEQDFPKRGKSGKSK